MNWGVMFDYDLLAMLTTMYTLCTEGGPCFSSPWLSGMAAALLLATKQGSGSAAANKGTPQTPPQTSACEAQNLNAVNNQFGTNFTSANVTGEFQFSTGAPPGQGTLNLNISGGGVSPGRYPVNWWTYVIGYGPTLHIPAGPSGFDSPSTLVFSSSQFTEHLDSAFPYNPIGALVHLLEDFLGIGGHKACP